MDIDGRTFKFLRTSDLDRDGMSFEAWEGDSQVAEVFYSDENGSSVFSAFAKDLPTQLILYMVTDGVVQITPARKAGPE